MTGRTEGPSRLRAWTPSGTAIKALTAVLVLAAAASSSSPARAAGAVTLPGGPLVVSVGPAGQCQSHYLNAGNDFFPATGALGDCGFFLGFPKAGNPTALREQVFGFAGANGPGLGTTEYTPVDSGSTTGAGTSSDPYELATSFKVTDAASKLDYALVTERTTYVNGDPQFTSSFDVENVTGQTVAGLTPDPVAATLKFHAIYAGDLSTDNSDFGVGVLQPGPPRFVGAQNDATGVLGGLLEAGPPSPAWSDFQVGCWDAVPEPFGRCPATSAADHGIWSAVRAASGEAAVFNDDIDANLIDNAVGVSWDDHLKAGLSPGAHASYSIVNRAQIPAALSLQPATQAHRIGETATIAVTAKNTAGTPYANRPLVYAIGSANPKSGSVTTDTSGVATISYVGTAPGADTIKMFLDLAGSGVQAVQDPASAAQIAWAQASPTPRSPNSGYRVQSIRAGSTGVVTILFTPVQDGTATVVVAAPTATIARSARPAASRRCPRGLLRVKGRCRAKTTVAGRASARARAGAAVKMIVRPSSRVRSALSKGRTVRMTVKLTYQSALGGKATSRVFHVKAKGKRKRHH
ncbi:MAG TPA: Ig-like domain-containing protein [Solirubrobacteraceae bacterium]|nr:Ig-like domain-containing protein [Solirubrobacteraceae bacterium]